METIRQQDSGAAVEDVQMRLAKLGLLGESEVDGFFGATTAVAVRAFCRQNNLDESSEVTEKVWSALVDATFSLGDRTLYLRMPYFHGNDVKELQSALGALGFACGTVDGIFGAHTELALRKFQMNMGLPTDGIAGAYTYAAVRNLHHSWEGKEAAHEFGSLGFSRAAEVLEHNALCLFGTQEFTRSVASRMSNLALATTPVSHIVSAESLLVAPDTHMLLVHIVLPEEKTQNQTPCVVFTPENTLPVRLGSAMQAARDTQHMRISIELPGKIWENAGEDRSAQHFAIALLDAVCAALA